MYHFIVRRRFADLVQKHRKDQVIKALLQKEFAMTDLGSASSFLRIHIERNEDGTM